MISCINDIYDVFICNTLVEIFWISLSPYILVDKDKMQQFYILHMDVLLRDCGNSFADALGLPQSCTKPSVFSDDLSNFMHLCLFSEPTAPEQADPRELWETFPWCRAWCYCRIPGKLVAPHEHFNSFTPGRCGSNFKKFSISYRIRVDSRLAPSQWETSLQSNAVSHWLSANL